MSHMTIQEMENRAVDAENRATKFAGQVDALRAKEEQYQRDLNIVREEKFKSQQAFNKLWGEYQALVQSTPPEAMLERLGPKQEG